MIGDPSYLPLSQRGMSSVLFLTLAVIPGLTHAASGDYTKDIVAFQQAFSEGRMNDGAGYVPQLISALATAKPLERMAGLRRIHDLCLASYQIGCEQQAFGDLIAVIREVPVNAEIADDVKKLLVSDFKERVVRRILLYDWATDLAASMPLLERSVDTWIGVPNFPRSNLTLAQAYLRLDNLERATFYSRRGWYFFLCNQRMTADDFQGLMAEFVEVFIATGQTGRALTALTLFRKLVFNMGDSRPYFQFRLIAADFGIQNALNDPDGIVRAGRFSLSMLKSLQFVPLVADYFELRLLAATIAGCLVLRDSSCQLAVDVPRATQLLTKIADSDHGIRSKPFMQGAAAFLALHSLFANEPAPPVLNDVLNDDFTQKDKTPLDGSLAITLAGRALLLAHADRLAARRLLGQAAGKMLHEMRRLQAVNIFESAPLAVDGRLLVDLAIWDLADNLDSLSEEERNLLFELVSLSNRSWRSVESQYLHASARLPDDSQRASLQAHFRLEQEIVQQEREAIRDLLDIAAGRRANRAELDVDYPRFSRFNEIDRLQRLHATAVSAASLSYKNGPNLLDETRASLHPGERFITHAIAFNRLVRVCFDRESFHAKSLEREPQRELLAVKTLLAALTNPSPTGSAIDQVFPLAEAKFLTALILGNDDSCIGQAETLIAAPDPVFFSLPLHVLLDPTHAATTTSTVTLATAPWLGASRGLSIVTDPQQFIASRAMAASRGAAPLAFLGCRRSLALRQDN